MNDANPLHLFLWSLEAPILFIGLVVTVFFAFKWYDVLQKTWPKIGKRQVLVSIALYSQSKRLPLIWDRLGVNCPNWLSDAGQDTAINDGKTMLVFDFPGIECITWGLLRNTAGGFGGMIPAEDSGGYGGGYRGG